MSDTYLKKEDYEEPCCPLKMKTDVTPIPQRRVIEKLDEYLNKNDYISAEKHLIYWLSEAKLGNDDRGKLTVLNEQIGLYRKLYRKDECINAIESALNLIESLNMDYTVTLGTTFLNCATGYKAFGNPDKAIVLYRKAQKLYEALLDKNDERLGGLYNNTALTLTELEKYSEAEEMYGRAIQIMSQNENKEGEIAITYLNLADMLVAQFGMEKAEERIFGYLDKAEELLNTPSLPRNGYYAFICDKCASVFGHYGYFMTEKELKSRAREIYERN